MRTHNSSCDTLDRMQPAFADTDPGTSEQRSLRSPNSSTRPEQHQNFVRSKRIPPTLWNEMAELLADIIHSLVASKLEKMVDRMRGSSLRRDEPLAIVGGVISFLFHINEPCDELVDLSGSRPIGWQTKATSRRRGLLPPVRALLDFLVEEIPDG